MSAKSKIFFLLTVFVVIGVLIYSTDSASAQVTGLTSANVSVIIGRIISWLLSIAAALTILFLIIGGIYYLTAAGDDQQMTTAKSMISYAITGLIFIVISYSIVITINNFIKG